MLKTRPTPAGDVDDICRDFVKLMQASKITAKPVNLHQIAFTGPCGGVAYAEARVNPLTNSKFVEIVGSFSALSALNLHTKSEIHLGEFKLSSKLVYFENIGYSFPCIDIERLPTYVFI